VGRVTPPAGFEQLDPIVGDPARAGLFCDFDGTLSEIIDEPDLARPLDGLPDLLGDLAGELGVVGVLSGRPVSFLQPLFPRAVLLAGLYGLETLVDGQRRDHPLGGTWREVIDDVASSSIAHGPVGMHVEEKGLSLTLHFRTHPELEGEVRAFAEKQGARSGLEVRSARMSYELHPPIAVDKGTALLELTRDLTSVCFIGDDVGDLPAFDALDELAARGVRVVRVAVRSAEESAELVGRADVRLDGPAGVGALLRHVRQSVDAA
jgi:trehalose 6-phosphate phosphatase